MTTNAPDGREHRDDEHDQDSEPPTPFGQEPDGPGLETGTDEPGADPDPEPGDVE